jgi:hypothetical protein
MSSLEQRLSTPHRDRVVKNPMPWYTPRFWHGMTAGTWLRELARNRFAVSPSRIPMAASVTCFSLLNSALAGIDRLVYGRRVARTELRRPPLFILGHWRSGTTFLHELLIRDPEHTYPTTYQCFVPHHFLLTQSWIPAATTVLLPKRRPMDNMQAGWDRPQEDEFALQNWGVPSPYLSMMFPNRGPSYPSYLTLEELAPAERRRWRRTLVEFFRRIACNDPRRIVVKSPGHTARVRTLAEAFPDAKFVHIAREPNALFASTVALWRSLNEVQGAQAVRRDDWVEPYVLDSLRTMYDAYFADRSLLAEDQLVELRYEQLIEDPKASLRQVYRQLDLGDFSRVEPAIDAHLDEVKNYRANRYSSDESRSAELHAAWGRYFQEFGYESRPRGARPVGAPSLTSG